MIAVYYKVSANIFGLAVYPNPCGNSATISYKLLTALDVSIIMTDLMGKEVAVIINAKQQTAGEYKVQLNTSAFGINSGIFLLSMKSGNSVIMKKLVIVK